LASCQDTKITTFFPLKINSFMKKGSAVVVGPKDEADAVSLYKELLATA
jgi:hypothetical protein